MARRFHAAFFFSSGSQGSGNVTRTGLTAKRFGARCACACLYACDDAKNAHALMPAILQLAQLAERTSYQDKGSPRKPRRVREKVTLH